MFNSSILNLTDFKLRRLMFLSACYTYVVLQVTYNNNNNLNRFMFNIMHIRFFSNAYLSYSIHEYNYKLILIYVRLNTVEILL